MIKYSMPKNDKEAFRTDAYVFTVSSKDDPSLIQLRENVKAHNRVARRNLREAYAVEGDAVFNRRWYSIRRVQLMARGPRTIPALKDGLHRRSYDQSLPHEHATHFDVYVREDTYAMYVLRDQLNRNLTPGQWQMIREAETLMWKHDMKVEQALRKAGIKTDYSTGRKRYIGE